MDSIYFGIGLIVLGLVIFFVGRFGGNRSSAQASNGSVAIGRDNSGPVANINIGEAEKKGHGGHGITAVAIIVELLGIGVTLWHAFHLSAK